MNDYEMIKLAADRSHDFRREADQARLARSVTRHSADQAAMPIPSGEARSTLRLTLHHLLGRVHA